MTRIIVRYDETIMPPYPGTQLLRALSDQCCITVTVLQTLAALAFSVTTIRRLDKYELEQVTFSFNIPFVLCSFINFIT